MPNGETVSSVAARLFALVDSECGEYGRANVRDDLDLFLSRLGSRSISSLTADDLTEYRKALATGRAPKTINQRLQTVRRVLNLAEFRYDNASREAVKPVRAGPKRPKAWTVEKVCAVIAGVHSANPNLAKILRLAFLCCLRPSEISGVAYGQGEWVAPNVFALARSKTEKRTGEKRAVCFSPSALALLKTIEPQCPDFKALRSACRRASKWVGFNFTAHPLRHSAATSLISEKVDVSLVRCALGRALPPVDGVYFPQPYEKTCRALERLARLVPAPQSRSVNPIREGLRRKKKKLVQREAA